MVDTLYDTTRDLHHACEKHAVGGAMSDGSISKQWWADWLQALYQIHLEIDGDREEDMLSRVKELEVDIKGSLAEPRSNASADLLQHLLRSSEKHRLAARYVITGAHLMGGQVTRQRIAGKLPCAHLHYGNRKELMNYWSPLRERVDLTDEARDIFQNLLYIMDDIVKMDSSSL